MNEYELYHHGILAQKWGIRRYQNPDGSYKPAAEGRYDPAPSNRKRKNARVDGASSSKYIPKNARTIISTANQRNGESTDIRDRIIYGRLGQKSSGYKNVISKMVKGKNEKNKKTESELEDEEIARRADALQKKNPGMSRQEAESAAEDDMISEAKEKRKAGKTAQSDDSGKWTEEDLNKYFGEGYFDTTIDQLKKILQTTR